jgi:hypothetical protein
MRRLSEQAGRSANARRTLADRARECLAFTAIFLLVPLVGLSALVAPPWAVDQVTAPLWRTVWAPVGAALAAHHEAPLLQPGKETGFVATGPTNAAVQVAAKEPPESAKADPRVVLESRVEPVRHLVDVDQSLPEHAETVEAPAPSQEPRSALDPPPAASPADERGADGPPPLAAAASGRAPELPDEDEELLEFEGLGNPAPDLDSGDLPTSEAAIAQSDEGNAGDVEEPSGADLPGHGNSNAPHGNVSGNSGGNAGNDKPGKGKTDAGKGDGKTDDGKGNGSDKADDGKGNGHAGGNGNGNSGGNSNGNGVGNGNSDDDGNGNANAGNGNPGGNPGSGPPENAGGNGTAGGNGNANEKANGTDNGNGNGNGGGNSGGGPPENAGVTGNANGNGNGNDNSGGPPKNDPGKGKSGGRRRRPARGRR